jgi:hypothetical protein
MDEARARSLLESMTAWDQIPALTTEQVDSLMILSQRSDPYGLTPADNGYSPTWDLNAGAAEGWRWKAASVSGSFDFVTDSQRFDRSQMAAMCLTMSAEYRRRILVSAVIPSGLPIIPPPVIPTPVALTLATTPEDLMP